jgi:uncharacterized protein (TIGR03905 family)
MHYDYDTIGTCAKHLSFDLDEQQRVHNLSFVGGCNGNLKAISKLVEGQDAHSLIILLDGNTCGFKKTSCTDQLAKALTKATTE